MSRLARWSAALGTIGLLTAVFGVGVLLALVAIACATVALNRISTAPAPDVQGVAVVGLLAGVLALLVFPLLLATAVPRFVAAKQSTAHAHCYSNLLEIDAAKDLWAQQNRLAPSQRVSLNELVSGGALTDAPRCPSGGHYIPGTIGKLARCSFAAHNEAPGPKQPPERLRFSHQNRVYPEKVT